MNKTHRKTRKIIGGISIIKNYDPPTAFDFFIKNATFSVFSTRGTNCTIVLAKLNPYVESPYRTDIFNMGLFHATRFE